jgi:hypothetical protein
VPLGGLHRLGSAGGGQHLEARIAEAGREELKYVRLVFDD